MKRISDSKLLPTPFVYVSSKKSLTERLSSTGHYSAHVYVFYRSPSEEGVLMLHSLRYNNVFGPGGEINKDESVFDGLLREMSEEMPVLVDFVKSKLLRGDAVGMWRRTGKGVHNTFVIEATPADFDIWEKQRDLGEVIEKEKAALNRPDHLEADGGLVFVPFSSLDTVIANWEHSDKSKDPFMRCLVGNQEGLPLPLRRFIVPVVGELQMLYNLLKSFVGLREAFDSVQRFYYHLADNEWAIIDQNPLCRFCIACKCERARSEDFDKGLISVSYIMLCSACGYEHAKARFELQRVETPSEIFCEFSQKPVREWYKRMTESQ